MYVRKLRSLRNGDYSTNDIKKFFERIDVKDNEQKFISLIYKMIASYEKSLLMFDPILNKEAAYKIIKTQTDYLKDKVKQYDKRKNNIGRHWFGKQRT